MNEILFVTSRDNEFMVIASNCDRIFSVVRKAEGFTCSVIPNVTKTFSEMIRLIENFTEESDD